MSVWILLVVFDGLSSQSGMATIQQEFTSRAACEHARTYMVTTLSTHSNTPVRAQGCFPKYLKESKSK